MPTQRPFAFQPNAAKRFSVLRPALLTLPLLLWSLWAHWQLHRFTRITDFIEISHKFAPAFGVDSLATSPSGFDGQFYYFMARFPGQLPIGAFDTPAKRYSRPLYPLIVHLASLGNATIIPWVMIAINVAAIVGAVFIVSWLLRERGLPTWPALLVGLYCGQPLALLKDLTDPLGVLWLSVALLGVQRRRWLLTAAAIGLGVLTRESGLVFAACFAVPLLLARDWRTFAKYMAVACGPYVVWTVLVTLAIGHAGLVDSAQTNEFVLIPFSGLTAAAYPYYLVLMILFAAIPAVIAIGLGCIALSRRPRHDPFMLVAAVSAVAYGAAVAFQPSVMWIDLWGPMRMSAPLAALVPFLMPRSSHRYAWKAVTTLMLASLVVVLLA